MANSLKYPEAITYHEAASFAGFVTREHGWQKFRQLWTRGFSRLPAILGQSTDEVEQAWRRALAEARRTQGSPHP